MHPSKMAWLLSLAPAAALGFALGHIGDERLRRRCLVILLAAPLVIVGGMLLLGLGLSRDVLDGGVMVAPVMGAWITAVAVSYFASRRFAR
jgi:hypothetical protein